VTIGPPLSANKMYTPSKKYGMVKSTAYRKWIALNTPLITDNLDKAERFPIEIDIKICGGREFTNKSDLDNCLKSSQDLLVRCDIIPDDSIKYVTKCNLQFFPFSRGEALTIISYTEPDLD